MEPKGNIEVAVVILNWNGQKFLEKFLPGVLQNSRDHASIYVADNNSSDDSVAYLKEHFPEVKIILNKENGGFAKGYNDALKEVEADYYVLLNSDVEVGENWISPIIGLLEKNEKIAACQPKIKSFHDKKLFEHAGACGGFLDYLGFPFCRGRIFHKTEEDKGQYDNAREVFWATGACLFIRSHLFHGMGGFDEKFFAHMEEIDLCWRMKNQGHEIWVNPESVVYHVGGGTLSTQSPFKTFLNFRNSLHMLMKNHRGMFTPGLVFWRMVLDGIAGVKFLLDGQPQHTWAVLKAHLYFYLRWFHYFFERQRLKKLDGKRNLRGFYRKSIVWAFYLKHIEKFKDLPKRP